MVLFGGRRPINVMSKKEASKALAQRAKANIKKKDKSDINEPDFDIPREICSFINPIKEKIKAVEYDIKNDKPVIKPTMEKMSDSDIRELKGIFEADKGQNKRINTEDKLVAGAHLTIKEIKKIDEIVPHLLHLRECLVGSFVEAYSAEYSISKGSERVFSNEDFLKDLDHIISYRSGLMRGSERSDLVQNEPLVQSQDSCSVM